METTVVMLQHCSNFQLHERTFLGRISNLGTAESVVKVKSWNFGGGFRPRGEILWRDYEVEILWRDYEVEILWRDYEVKCAGFTLQVKG